MFLDMECEPRHGYIRVHLVHIASIASAFLPLSCSYI